MSGENPPISSFSKELRHPIREHYAGYVSADHTKESGRLGDKLMGEASDVAASKLLDQLEHGKNVTPQLLKIKELETIDAYFEKATEFLEKELEIKDDKCWLIEFPQENEKYTFFTKSHDQSYPFGEAYTILGGVRGGKQEAIYKGIKVIGKRDQLGGIKAFRNQDGKIIAYPKFSLINYPSKFARENRIAEWAERGNITVMQTLEQESKSEKDGFLTRLLHKPERIGTNGELIVFEYIDGPSLEDIIKRHVCLDENDFAAIGQELALSAFFLHKGSETKRPSIHRNIKPSNIYISTDDGCLKLTNYGMLKEVVIKDANVNLTRNIIRPGTGEGKKLEAIFSDSLYYMPPEAAYNYVSGNPQVDGKKIIYLRRLDPKDIADRATIKNVHKEDIFSIDGYLWIETRDPNYIAAYKDKTGNLLIEGFCDEDGEVEKKRKCYKAFRDNSGNGNVVVMDTKSDVFQIGATLYEMISGGRNPVKYAASAFNDPEEFIRSMAMIVKVGGKPKKRIPSLKDYMLCSSVREVPKGEIGPYLQRFKVKMSEEGIGKVESMYVVDDKLMLICNKRGRFLDENGKKSPKVFSSAGEGYYLRKKKMQRTNDKLLLNIHNNIIDSRINDSLCEIVDWCLEPDPDDRPTTYQVCEMFYCFRNGIRIKNRKYPQVDEEKMWGFFRESVEKRDFEVFASIASKINQNG